MSELRPATPVEAASRNEIDALVLAYLVAHGDGARVRLTRQEIDDWLDSIDGTFRVHVEANASGVDVSVDSVNDGRVPGVIYVRDVPEATLSRETADAIQRAGLRKDAEDRYVDPVNSGVDRAVDTIERALHPRGRCVECGGGEPYWRHDPGIIGSHPFAPVEIDPERLARAIRDSTQDAIEDTLRGSAAQIARDMADRIVARYIQTR